MRKRAYTHRLAVAVTLWALAVLPAIAPAQTRVSMPRNKYKVQDDVRIGREYSTKIEQQFPLLNDGQTERYIENVGRRLVAAIPPQFQQSAFNYEFDVVNASDINAFALPGGPMYVNRGMIEAARNEGEMAGVMAHEIAHVALRHATAQATKQGSVGNQLGTIGLILGGAILGGRTGAQIGALGAQAWMTKYSREYETQADVLGSQILADAGYDPRDLANMFRTIEQQSRGGRGPEWLSSHPNPGNRYQNINREAGLLGVSPNPIKITREFERVQARLREMPRAPTMAEIERGYRGQVGGVRYPTSSGRYSNNVEFPSTRTRLYSGGNWLRVNVPENWREFSTNDGITFAPEGAYGNEGITHGAMIGMAANVGGSLQQASQNYIRELLQNNNYLRQQSGFRQAYLGGRQAYVTTLAGRSPVTGQEEVVTIYTTSLRNGNLLYVAMVAPSNETYRYNTAFRGILSSIRLND